MHLENLLSEETSKMPTTTGGWAVEANCTISHNVRGSLFFETLDSDVRQNRMDVKAVSGGDMTVVTERFRIRPGIQYKAWAWVGGATMLDTEIGLRFYSVDSSLLQDNKYTYSNLIDGLWAGTFIVNSAPANSVRGEMYVTFKAASAGQEMSIARPSVMPQDQIFSTWLEQSYVHIPDYIVEADLEQGSEATGAPTPMSRYLAGGTNQHHIIQDDIISWDFVHKVDTDDGEHDTSSLVDPYKSKVEWLPWIAQLMGVSLDTVPSGGRSPWLAFETAGIDTWVEWEEDVDPGSIPGIPDTEWSDIETFSPDFFDVEGARRLQIAAGFNGVLGGTSESIIEYVGALLNSDDEEPFVYVVKHYGTNPYRILVAVLETEDPDPSGDMLERAVESATPAGTDVIVEHGVSATALSFYRIPDMFRNMWTSINQGSNELDVRFVENTSANGKHLRTASISTSTEPFYGGGVALARWHPGFAMYSGAARLKTAQDPSFNLLGDLDIRILLSDVDVPDSGVLELASSDGKWSIGVNSSGFIQFTWENSGTQTKTSDAAPDWGNVDKGPFWIRVVLDINNDAAGHDVLFYESPTLYEDAWNQVGTTITTAGVSGIDTSPTADLQVFEYGTNPNDSVSALVYRVMIHDGIAGSIAADLNMIGEFDPALSYSPHTGTSFWRFPISNIGINIQTAAEGATNLVESRWVSNNHAGKDDYFYFGKSPYADDNGNPTSLGDTLTVTGLTSDNYEWTMTLLDGSTIVDTVTSATSITWDSDDYGGNSIVNIIVRTDPGGVVAALFAPDIFVNDTTAGLDVYSKTWTLVRSFNTSYYYEYSAFHDRDSISVFESDAAFFSNMVFDADESLTVAVDARRFWSSAGVTEIVDHTTTSGWKLQYNGNNIEAIVTDGTSPVTLTYDEVTGGTLGQFNLITLRRDIINNEISLWINDTKQDFAADPFATGSLFTTVGDTGTFGDGVANRKFDFRYFGIYNRALTDKQIGLLFAELGRLVQVLPQASQTVNVPIILNPPTVYTPGFDITWDISAPHITATTTVHAPQVNMSVLVNYIASGHTVHEPTSVSIV